MRQGPSLCARAWPLRPARSVSAAAERVADRAVAERLTCCTGGKYTLKSASCLMSPYQPLRGPLDATVNKVMALRLATRLLSRMQQQR